MWWQKLMQPFGSNRFTLVAGMSSSGKSCYCAHMPDRPIRFAHAVTTLDEMPNGTLLHYNTMRYARNSADLAELDFFSDQLLNNLQSCGVDFDIRFLVCQRSELLRRINRRKIVEDAHSIYPGKNVRTFVEAIDYARFQTDWLRVLRTLSPNVTILHSDNGRFDPISENDFLDLVAAPDVSGTAPSRSSEDESDLHEAH